MKKNLFMVTAVALMALVSCNKEEISNGVVESNKPSFFVEFSAGFDMEEDVLQAAPDTKTSYDSKNKKTLWESNDLISVNGNKFEIKELASDKLSAKFTNATQLNNNFGAPYMAVYPYSSNLSFSNQTVNGIVVNSTPSLDTKGANIAIAYQTNGNELLFKNVTSMICFSVNMDGVKEVEISSNNGDPISGTVSVDWNSGVPKIKEITNGSSSIVIKGNFVKGTKYYVNVIPQTLETGVTIRLNGIIAKTKHSSVTLGRSKVMKSENLALVEAGWTITGNFTDNGLNTWNPGGGVKMYKEESASWFVAKNVSMTTGFSGDYAQFKITNGSWDVAYGADNFEINKWWGTSGGNAYIKKGTYDIYFNESEKRILATPVGSKALTVYLSWDNRTHLWYWSEQSEIANVMSMGWPGATGAKESIDGWNYYKWMIVIPAENVGQNLKFIFSSNNGNDKLETPNYVNMTNVMFYNGENGAFLK